MRALAILAALAACGPRTTRHHADERVPWASSGVDWSRPPEPLTVARWQPPSTTELTLASGVRVRLVENHRLPIVAVTAIHTGAGGRVDTVPGLAALTADAIASHTSLEAAVATDYASHHVVVQTSELHRAVDELGKAIRHPELADADIVHLRDARLRVLATHRDSARTVAAQIFDRVVFGAHPYGAPAEGLPETVAKLTPELVRTFWERSYRPATTTIVLSGDVPVTTIRAQLESAFGDWKDPARPALGTAAPLPAYVPQLACVDVPGATDAVVIVGSRAGGAPGTLAQDLANALLGGGTDGVLERVLHGERAYTYGASSSFWRGLLGGSWAATATFRNDVAGDALRTMLSLVETARTHEPTAAELARVRDDFARATARSFETAASSARALQRLVVLGRPATWFAALDAELAGVAPPALPAAVSDVWRDLSVVVVGDWRKIGGALQGVGLPVVAYRADGTPVP
jgi:zinc protease